MCHGRVVGTRLKGMAAATSIFDGFTNAWHSNSLNTFQTLFTIACHTNISNYPTAPHCHIITYLGDLAARLLILCNHSISQSHSNGLFDSPRTMDPWSALVTNIIIVNHDAFAFCLEITWSYPRTASVHSTEMSPADCKSCSPGSSWSSRWTY